MGNREGGIPGSLIPLLGLKTSIVDTVDVPYPQSVIFMDSFYWLPISRHKLSRKRKKLSTKHENDRYKTSTVSTIDVFRPSSITLHYITSISEVSCDAEVTILQL